MSTARRKPSRVERAAVRLLHAAKHEDDDGDCCSTCESATLRLLMSPSFQVLFLIAQIVLTSVMQQSNTFMRPWVIGAIFYLVVLATLGRRRALYLGATMAVALMVYRVLEVATVSSHQLDEQLTDLDAVLPWVALAWTSLGAIFGLQPAEHLRYSWKIQVAVAVSLLRSSTVTIVLIRTGDLRILKVLLILVPFWSGLLIVLHLQRATSLARTLTTMRTDLEHARSLDLQEEHQSLLRQPHDSSAPSLRAASPKARVSIEPSATPETAVDLIAPSADNLAVLLTVGNQQSSAGMPASEGAGPSGASQPLPSGDASDAGSDSTYATLYSSDDFTPSCSNNESLEMLGPATRALSFKPAFEADRPPAPQVPELPNLSLAELLALSGLEAAARLARRHGPFVWARLRLMLLGSIDPDSPLYGLSVDAIRCITRQYVRSVLPACARVADAPWNHFTST